MWGGGRRQRPAYLPDALFGQRNELQTLLFGQFDYEDVAHIRGLVVLVAVAAGRDRYNIFRLAFKVRGRDVEGLVVFVNDVKGELHGAVRAAVRVALAFLHGTTSRRHRRNRAHAGGDNAGAGARQVARPRSQKPNSGGAGCT